MRGMNTAPPAGGIIIHWQNIGLIVLGLVALVALILWLFKSPRDQDRR